MRPSSEIVIGSSPRGRGTRIHAAGRRAPLRFIPARAGNTPGGRRRRWVPPVHPRAGGEHQTTRVRASSPDGSSPRGRGTQVIEPSEQQIQRFIPARAGNTPRRRRVEQPRPVHPRAGGEHPGPWCWRSPAAGSSPRGRGTPNRRPLSWHRHRFIPARAGNTGLAGASPGTVPVHPRAGGEHFRRRRIASRFTGSSPRGRGTLSQAQDRLPVHRFIPARAGNTPGRAPARPCKSVHPRAGGEHLSPTVTEWHVNGSSPRGRGTPGTPFSPAYPSSVHPRAGGEHLKALARSRPRAGSSPRGRGTRAAPDRAAAGGRFIPARAGNTQHQVAPVGGRQVHPRAGGEHIAGAGSSVTFTGSSPRGRGTLQRIRAHLRVHRFIPARAGNTSPSIRPARSSTVHPRAGGEHRRRPAWYRPSRGSSPRGRGTLEGAREIPPPRRFIPARAGNTSSAGPSCCRRPVHPRAGGEHPAPGGARRRSAGSSPRGRGTHRRGRQLGDVHRFIPARAGNT